MARQHIIEFQHRDDSGPAWVGTFPGPATALTHILTNRLAETVWHIHELTHPEDDT